MMLPSDLTGLRFGRLIVAALVGKTPHRTTIWRCICDCGAETIVKRDELRTGDTQSCGCRRREVSQRLARQYFVPGNRLAHGHSRRGQHHPMYSRWLNMWNRCRNQRGLDWKDYGGRGIRVCDRWRDFPTFLADMGMPPSPIHSIDRIDTNGNYEPGNCRWATPKEQRANRRDAPQS